MGWIDNVAYVVKRRGNSLRSWAIAISLFLASLAFRLMLPPEAGRLPFLAFFPAIILSVLISGFWPGVVVLCLSVLAGWYLFLAPAHTFPHSPANIISLSMFTLAAALLLAVVEGLAQAIQKAEALAAANADLFRELQHRVANNFQIVAATLQRGRREIKDPAARAALDTAIARVQAMAALHRRLYDAKSYASGLEPVLTAVVAEVFENIPVQVKIDVSPRKLSLGEMTAIALLVNEAAINAAKYVFRPQKGRQFEVLLTQLGSDKLELQIHDDGPGIPPENQSVDGRPRFGLTVMRSLAQQLGGSLELPERSGGALRVEFPCRAAG